MLDAGLSSAAAHEDSAEFDTCEYNHQSTDELEAEITELCAHIDAATYRLLRAIAEFDRREAAGWGFQSTAHWLSWKVGIDLVTARDKVRVARALEGLPRISEKFRRGEVSYSKVRAMTRVATPKNEEYLLYIAERGTTEHVESVVRGYRRAVRGEGVDEVRRHREARYLEMYHDDDGMVVIRGRLPQEVAALLEKALQAAMDALREKAKEEDRVHQQGNAAPHDSAEASAPAVIPAEAGIPQHQSHVDVSNASAEFWCGDSFAQRRVDAPGLLAEAALGKGLGQTERGEPYQVMIHVDPAVLADPSGEGLCEFENGEGISAETCRRLACDAPYVTVTEDGDGNVLDIGRKARKISKPLWRALMSRDRTCRFPGCARTRHLEAHHIEHWATGGETNPDNLVVLCKYHHWAVHEGGVRVESRAPHALVFHRPDGTVLHPCSVPVPIHGEAGETLKEANQRYGLEITAETLNSLWDGERMDLSMAVDGLLNDDDDPDDRE
jgi:hypothetical protein